MSDFFTALDEVTSGASGEIRFVTRNLWFYDFIDNPLRIWDGTGKLITSDGNKWLGSVNAVGQNIHVTPNIQDGRNGSSISYEMKLIVPDASLFRSLKEDRDLAKKRDVTVYRALFKTNEALRPSTPIMFAKRMSILSLSFRETLEVNNGIPSINHEVTVSAKDSNLGRENKPNRTYSDSIQTQIAESHNLTPDLSCSYVANLANRTYTVS